MVARPYLSIIVNTRNRKHLLYRLLDTIRACRLNLSHEIIVVDDNSDEDYGRELKKRYHRIQFIRNESRLYLVRSRNKGWRSAKGEILFFIDDDNEIKDPAFFERGLRYFQDPSIGIIGCRTYYFDEPDIILIGPNRLNKITCRTTNLATNMRDRKSIEGLRETFDTPNAFFVRAKVAAEVQGFSDEIVQTLSEADFAEKVRKRGHKVYQASDLKVYHKSPRQTSRRLTPRHVGGTPERVYYFMRNKFVFMKKHALWYQRISFACVFSHMYTVYYLYVLVRHREFRMAAACIRGVCDGFLYMLK